MQNLYTEDGFKAIRDRLNLLHGDSPRLWGKMDAAQMLGHLRIPLEVPLGRHELPKMWLMKLFGPMIRKSILSGKPIKKNLATGPSMRVTDARHFETEKAALLDTLHDFIAAGKTGKLPPAHPYFGKLSSQEWSTMQFRHLDHHFTQFGV